MIYQGYEIRMCRIQCETWTLDDNGEPDEYLEDCHTHTDEPAVTYYLIGESDRILGSGHDLGGVKKYADALTLGLPA